MNISELQAIISNKDELLKALLKQSTLEALAGRFNNDRVSHLHTATLEDGSEITFKFVDTIKELIDNRLRKIPGKESYLSYFEIQVKPINEKGYSKIFDIKQAAPVHSAGKGFIKHHANIQRLKELAAIAGINLDDEKAWSHIFNRNYK